MLENASVQRVAFDLGETVWTTRKRSETSYRLPLNQRVQGSNPCAPTKPINVLGQDRAPTVKSGGTIWGTALGGQPRGRW